jgi:hypothetical protein
MHRADPLLDRLRGLPAAAVVGTLVLLQLVSLALLARSGNWSTTTGHAVLGGALVTADVVLLYAIGLLLGGPLFGLLAGLVWVLAPVFLLRYWVVGGSPPHSFGPIYHEQFLPAGFGFVAPGAVAAGCLLLLGGWLVLAPLSRVAIAGAGAGAAVAAAALVHPRVWPALAAPVLAYAVAGKPKAMLASAAVVLLGLGALALFRDVPAIGTSWNGIKVGLDQFREYSWSRRFLEYLPLAGLIGVGRRSLPGAAFFGWLLLTVVVFPLGRPLDLLGLLGAIVPGLPVYALLTASIVFLVPRNEAAAARVPEPG